MNDIRILVAETYPVTQEGIYAILEETQDLKLVAKTTTGQEALDLARKLQPNIFLFDLKIPGPPPVGLVVALRQQCPITKLLAFSADYVDTNFRDLINAGVAGFVDKTESPGKIVNAIYTVADGGVWFSQTALQQLIDEDNDPSPVKDFGLTARELEVLRLVVAGKTNRGIALAMEISVKTVEKCLTLIYDKLEVNSRVAAAVWAVRNGLI